MFMILFYIIIMIIDRQNFNRLIVCVSSVPLYSIIIRTLFTENPDKPNVFYHYTTGRRKEIIKRSRVINQSYTGLDGAGVYLRTVTPSERKSLIAINNYGGRNNLFAEERYQEGDSLLLFS